MSRQRIPLKILHVTFNMGIGGTEQVITQLIQGSDPAKLCHHVACIDGDIGGLGQQLVERGVPVWTMQRRSGIDIKLAWALRRKIRQEKIDVVHCHQYTPYFYGWLASLFTAASVVFTEHGRFYPDRHRTKAKWVNRLMAKTTSALTAISHSTARALAEYEFLPPKHIRVIYNGLQEKQVAVGNSETVARDLNIPKGARVFCMVSRLDPIKNHELALRAFRELKVRDENVVMLIVGDGPERKNIENLVCELKLSDQVRMLGYSAEPERYVAISDLYLLTSFSEGTSMTLLEAMSLGVGVVATNVGGNPEIIKDGQTGRLVPNDDLESLVNVLSNLLAHPEQIALMGHAAREAFKERFSVSSMVDQYSHVYQSIAESRL